MFEQKIEKKNCTKFQKILISLKYIEIYVEMWKYEKMESAIYLLVAQLPLSFYGKGEWIFREGTQMLVTNFLQ